MGVDFLDLTFRLEKRFGIGLVPTVWADVIGRRLGKKFDITAGEVYEVIAAQLKLNADGDPLPPAPQLRSAANVLEYQSMAGRRPLFEGDPWPAVRDEIAATLNVPAGQITPDSWLRHDLGME